MDSYTKCECGSGEKYKFCCQKAEAYNRKADRQIESKQAAAAIATLEEGLKKFPDTPGLVIRRAMLYSITGEGQHGHRILEAYLAKNPNHIGMRRMLLVNTLSGDGPEAAAIELQRFVDRLDNDQKRYMSSLVGMISQEFLADGKPLAAAAHATLEILWNGGQSAGIQKLMEIQQSPLFSYFGRHPWIPVEATDEVPETIRVDFARAHQLAMTGCWLDAAEIFGTIAVADSSAISYLNQGLCMAMIGENFAAVQCLRAFVHASGETERAVDIEALCQELEPPGEENLIDRLQLTWPIRSAETLEKNLKASDLFVEFQPETEDGKASDNGQRHYAVLNLPKLKSDDEIRIDRVPRVVAYVTIDEKNATLIAPDDGVLDATTVLFRETAGPAIVPAHPRTKHLGKTPKEDPMETLQWVLPEGLSAEARKSFFEERFAYDVENVWPKLPQKYLGRRTPQQAAAAGDARVPLRAALMILSEGQTSEKVLEAIAKVRESLGVPQEPTPSAESVEKLNIARLPLVDVKSLTSDQLAVVFGRSVRFFVQEMLVKSGEEWLSRPVGDARDAEARSKAYRELANEAMVRKDLPRALDLLKRGRTEDKFNSEEMKEAIWGMATVRCKAMTLEPADWVPELAVILDRKRSESPADEEVSQSVLMSLMDMGLVRLTPNPDRPDQVYMDTRFLEMLLQQFGPKITTAAGELGVSAAKGQIWTPGAAGASPAGGSKIWTPGQGSANPATAEGAAPKLFVPGK